MASVRILLVDDEPRAAQMLAKGLREQSYVVDVDLGGRTCLQRLSTIDYDAVILDVRLPVVDGLQLCERIRATASRVPVLMLTERDSVAARIAGLDSGADDCLTTPFDAGELYARLRALIRRSANHTLSARMTAGPLAVDTRSHQVTYRGHFVSLTKREYALLEYLVRRCGEVVNRGDITEHVWSRSHAPMSNTIDVLIQHLRRKLDSAGRDSIIHTRRGDGYVLRAQGPSNETRPEN